MTSTSDNGCELEQADAVDVLLATAASDGWPADRLVDALGELTRSRDGATSMHALEVLADIGYGPAGQSASAGDGPAFGPT